MILPILMRLESYRAVLSLACSWRAGSADGGWDLSMVTAVCPRPSLIGFRFRRFLAPFFSVFVVLLNKGALCCRVLCNSALSFLFFDLRNNMLD